MADLTQHDPSSKTIDPTRHMSKVFDLYPSLYQKHLYISMICSRMVGVSWPNSLSKMKATIRKILLSKIVLYNSVNEYSILQMRKFHAILVGASFVVVALANPKPQGSFLTQYILDQNGQDSDKVNLGLYICNIKSWINLSIPGHCKCQSWKLHRNFSLTCCCDKKSAKLWTTCGNCC